MALYEILSNSEDHYGLEKVKRRILEFLGNHGPQLPNLAGQFKGLST